MRKKDVSWTETVTTAQPVRVCGPCFLAVAAAPGAIVSDVWESRGGRLMVLAGRVCRVPMGGHRPDALAVLPLADRTARAAPCGVCGRTPCATPGLM